MANLREALKQRPDKTCAIMLDTKGPEIRTGLLVDHQPIELTAGQQLQIVTDYTVEGDNTRIACSYRALPETVQVGSIIYVADGALTCEVTEIQEVSKHQLKIFCGTIALFHEFEYVTCVTTIFVFDDRMESWSFARIRLSWERRRT